MWTPLVFPPCTVWSTSDPPGAESSHRLPFGDLWLVHVRMRQIYFCLVILYPARAQNDPCASRNPHPMPLCHPEKGLPPRRLLPMLPGAATQAQRGRQTHSAWCSGWGLRDQPREPAQSPDGETKARKAGRMFLILTWQIISPSGHSSQTPKSQHKAS